MIRNMDAELSRLHRTENYRGNTGALTVVDPLVITRVSRGTAPRLARTAPPALSAQPRSSWATIRRSREAYRGFFVPDSTVVLAQLGDFVDPIQDDCRDISLEIWRLTQEYNDARFNYEALLLAAIGGGINMRGDGTLYDPTGSLQWFLVQLEIQYATIQTMQTRLNILAVMYSQSNCDQMPEEPPGGGPGGGDDGSGLVGELNCHVEWLTMEISYDGGQTWQLYWEGYGNVCE